MYGASLLPADQSLATIRCKTFPNLWVAAFAALSVFGTEQINLDGGVRVPFLNEVTEIGSQGNFDGQNYTCPITANYFIYYRLVMDFFGDPPCGIDLVVGGERQVN